MILGHKAIDIRIQDIEGVGVPQGSHEAALGFAHRLIIKAAGQPGRARGIEIPAHGVRALLVQHTPGVHHVAQVLGHLVAVLVLHMAQHQAVLKGTLVKQQGADRQQRIEPSPGLIHGFRNKVSREALFKLLYVFKGIMPLGKGHGAGIIPSVNHFPGTVHVAATLRAL